MFTDREAMLLSTAPALLSPNDRQRAFILYGQVSPIQCPACLGDICRLAASTSDASPHPDDAYQCNRCDALLHWHLGLYAGQEWFTLRPGQTITVPSEPPPPSRLRALKTT
jgi:hypothetical protein